MRLFIAFDISEEATQHLKEIQKQLPGKLKLTKNFHLTLKFLGETTPEKAEQVKQKLSTTHFTPFTAKLNGTGIFPETGHPRVIWTGIEPAQTIKELQQQIDNELVPLFPKEKNFQPHLTLARVKELKQPEQINKIKIKPITFTVNQFKLYQSTLTTEGPIYKEIEKYPKA